MEVNHFINSELRVIMRRSGFFDFKWNEDAARKRKRNQSVTDAQQAIKLRSPQMLCL
jgi:nucleoside-specific outer membrane channel protein Tsx